MSTKSIGQSGQWLHVMSYLKHIRVASIAQVSLKCVCWAVDHWALCPHLRIMGTRQLIPQSRGALDNIHLFLISKQLTPFCIQMSCIIRVLTGTMILGLSLINKSCSV